MIVAHQTYGDMLRFNPHFHAIVLEGGFDDEGMFFYIPFSGLDAMVEVFRRRVVWLLVEKELLDGEFAIKLLGWKHSGISIDNSVRILVREAQINLAELTQHNPPKGTQLIRRYGLHSFRIKGGGRRWTTSPNEPQSDGETSTNRT